jgi:paraquat-inducible protein A
MKEAEQKETVDLIACHECDALLSRRSLPRRTTAHCPRCGTLLYRAMSSNLDRVCAITLAALITFLIAQAFPIVELDAKNMQVVAVLVFCSTILFPLTELVALLYVLVPLRAGYVPGGFNLVLRAIQAVRPWGMIEVFMLGILVTLVKMVSIARVIPEAALFAFGALTLMIAVVVSFDPGVLWDIAERLPRRRAARVRARRMRRNRESAGSATKHG